MSGDGTLSPLSISVNLSDGSAKTRALDKEFESADKLLAYIEHVDANSQTVNVDMSPSLVTLDVNADPVHKDITNGKETSSLTVSSIKQGSSELLPTGQTVLYWDDFSSSSNDINTTGHGLRVKYGYCLNGRVLDPAPTLGGDGIMTWSVIQNQRTAEKADYKKSDLLWSKTQESVAYSHSTDRAGLKIPYTHAMSKVTLVLIANEGFASTAFSATEATLLNMNISGSMHATEATITDASAGTGDDAGKVFMYKNTPTTTIIDEKTLPICTFEALVMPTKELTNGLVIASLTDVEGNNYNITISDEILKGFNKNVDESNPNDNTTPVIMKSGVNYKLTITLDKQPQTIVAQITDWNNVEATATGEIKFANDITSHNKDNQIDVNGASIALWRKATVTEFTGARTTTATFDNDNDGDETEDTWVCNPTLYWPDGVTPYHFRALAKYDAATATKYEAFSGEGEEDDDFKVKQGSDIVWATTAAHTGTYKDADGTTKTKEYGEGDPIYPRTGTVPMAFEHAMSKISVSLDGGTAGADMVNVTGAKISILNIYDGGTISLADGSIAASTLTASAAAPIKDYLPANDNESTGKKLSEVVVVPQSLLTMANGTARSGAVKFYDQNDLTTIYTNGTSIGTGEGTTYVTSTLDPVNYTVDQAQEYNAALAGHVTAGDAIYYTYEEYRDLQPNAGISVSDFEDLSEEQKVKTPAVTYTLAECDEENSKHLVADENGKNPGDDGYDTTYPGDYTPLTESSVRTPAVLYEYEEYKALKPYAEMTKDQFDALNAADKKKGEYTAETAAAFNATLPGAKSTSDFHHYKPKDGDASIKANPGDVKLSGNNPKVVLHILLADGTTYTLDLASCTPHVNDDENEDIAWERGKHYNYEISLRKEDITFRAMVKDWVEKSTSGNATLEWD